MMSLVMAQAQTEQAFPAVVIIVLVVLVLFAVALYQRYLEKERREALRAWAAAKGLSFREDRHWGFETLHPTFSCLKRGDNRYAYNVIEGALAGYEARLFDYHYETYSTDSKGNRQTHHHHFSAALVISPFRLRPISIRPEGIVDKIAGAFGWDDIDFESAEFSRLYHVKAEDRRWAFDVIHGPIIEMLINTQGYAYEGDELAMICYASNRLHPAGLEQAFLLVREILDRIPQHARERVQFDAK